MPNHNKQSLVSDVLTLLTNTISETNGINLNDTIELLDHASVTSDNHLIQKSIAEFRRLLYGFHQNEVDIYTLLSHPISHAFFSFFKRFPIKFQEEHIHLTGSLTAEFIYPRLKVLIEGPDQELYKKKITDVYGDEGWPIKSVEDVDHLIRLQDGEQFMTYLKILYLAKLVLVDKKAHEEAAYHMASELYSKYNVGHIRLKFTLNRQTTNTSEQVPGTENVTEEDVVFGLYDGFKKFQKENPDFGFILSPSFRKEAEFFDQNNYETKQEHFLTQVDKLLELIENRPELRDHLNEVDTVGDERGLYRKKHFLEMKAGFRRLQYNGFRIRSHHGETWRTLRKGVQSVDNAMNIWQIDTLEHGLSLGINPNYYYHRIYQRVLEENRRSRPIRVEDQSYREIMDMEWAFPEIRDKLIAGTPITQEEEILFIKTKFHTAREIEHYQHDVLNRMINKNVTLVALPTSNLKLTNSFPDYKDHPFSWWENKGLDLGVGTDNYVTLSTNFIQELLILLYSNPENLKITKLLMVATKENRRAYISHLLWKMRKELRKERQENS
jgi:adenosine deaminase